MPDPYFRRLRLESPPRRGIKQATSDRKRSLLPVSASVLAHMSCASLVFPRHQGDVGKRGLRCLGRRPLPFPEGSLTHIHVNEVAHCATN